MFESWPLKKLGDCLEIQNGYAFASKQFDADLGMQLIRIRDLKNGTTTQVKFQGEYDQRFVVNKGDLLIGMDGEFVCHEWKGEPSLLNQRVCRLQNFSSELLPRFVYYGINKYLKVIEDNTSYTTVKHLSGKKIKDIDFPIPPLKEQQRIVNILDDAFANINLSLTKLQQKIPSLLELFQSHLNRLFDSKDEHWNEHTLEEISEALITKGATPTTYGFPFVDEGITFLRSECVSDHGFEPNGIRYISEEANVHMKRSIVKGGDVLISITGYLGRVVRYPTHMDDGNINQHIARVRINNETINPDFIVYQLQSERIQNHYRDVYTGTAQPLLSLKQIRETVVFIPPITVQHEIIDSLNNFYVQTREIEGKYQTRLDSLAELKQSMLQEAFSGKLTGGITA